ncbi:MAG TPA: C13 family peptidase [Xanthobacteraceae bacterium]|nr:C13 family peptidase [Xanthobacteraceae bacterium]
MWSVLKVAARAAIWRTTPDPPPAGLVSLLGWAVVLAAVRVALQYAAAGPASHFNPYGLNAVVAWLALELAVAAFFVRPAGRATALAAMFILSIIADIAAASIELGAPLVAAAATLNAFWTRAGTAAAVFTVEIVWWIGAMVCVLRGIEPQSQLRLIGRAAALWVALFAVNALVPHAPAFLGRDFDIRDANWWEYFYARYGEVASLERAQAALLKTELDGLAPHQGATNVYAIGLAGMDQDVFVKELDGALASIATVLPIKDRTVRLINSHETAATVPLANPENFAAAAHAVAEKMDKDDDVLVLVMTSHGDQGGVGLQLPGRKPTELTPQQVAATLDGEGIKNRVVIVSACFSGIFLEPLQNDNTIVMTAADAKSTSFGCAPERDWTYFGDAFFRQSLQPGTDFQHAFDHARVLIQGWELMDRLPPSNPQAAFGPALVAKLAPFFQAAPSAGQ